MRKGEGVSKKLTSTLSSSHSAGVGEGIERELSSLVHHHSTGDRHEEPAAETPAADGGGRDNHHLPPQPTDGRPGGHRQPNGPAAGGEALVCHGRGKDWLSEEGATGHVVRAERGIGTSQPPGGLAEGVG